MSSKTADWTINKLIVIGGAPLVVFAKTGGKIMIKACDLSKWTGTVKVKGKGTVTLGAGC